MRKSLNPNCKLMVIVLVIINIGLIFCFIIKNIEYERKRIIIEEINDENVKLKSINNLLIGKIMDPYLYDNKYISSKLRVEDTKENKMKIIEIVTENTLVMWFKNEHCEQCISETLMLLNNFFEKKVAKISFVILTDKDNKRRMLISKEFETLKIPVFFIDDNLKELDNLNSPALFILKKDMKIENFFIPDKSLPRLTNQYLNIITRNVRN